MDTKKAERIQRNFDRIRFVLFVVMILLLFAMVYLGG